MTIKSSQLPPPPPYIDGLQLAPVGLEVEANAVNCPLQRGGANQKDEDDKVGHERRHPDNLVKEGDYTYLNCTISTFFRSDLSRALDALPQREVDDEEDEHQADGQRGANRPQRVDARGGVYLQDVVSCSSKKEKEEELG